MLKIIYCFLILYILLFSGTYSWAQCSDGSCSTQFLYTPNQGNQNVINNNKIINENFASHLERIKKLEDAIVRIDSNTKTLADNNAITDKNVKTNKTVTDLSLGRIDNDLNELRKSYNSNLLNLKETFKNNLETFNKNFNKNDNEIKTFDLSLKSIKAELTNSILTNSTQAIDDVKTLKTLVYLLSTGTGVGGIAILVGQYLLRRKLHSIKNNNTNSIKENSVKENSVKEVIKEVPIIKEVVKVVENVKEVPIIKEIVKEVPVVKYIHTNQGTLDPNQSNTNQKNTKSVEMTYVPYEQDVFTTAYKEACQSVAKKYPGYVDALEHLDAVIKQYVNANPTSNI